MMVMIMIKLLEKMDRSGEKGKRKGLGEGERGKNYGNRNMLCWNSIIKYLREWDNS